MFEEKIIKKVDMDSLVHTAEELKKYKRPRLYHTHLPFNLLPKQIRTGEKKPKIIYLVRNAKDVCLSNFKLYQAVLGFLGTWDEFCSLFMGGKSNFISN